MWTAGILGWRLRRRPSQTSHFTVSVIVAGRNEQAFVEGCLAALCALEYPPELLEICFVDDHSQDGTLSLARAFASNSSRRIQVLSAPECPPDFGPKKNALRHGVNNTSGDILFFTDADGKVNTGWIRSLISWYDEKTGAVIGTSLPARQDSAGRKLYRLERLLAGLTSASAAGLGSPASAGGMSLSYRRAAFDQLGGFAFSALRSGDDDLMVQAVKQLGWKVRFSQDPDCVVSDLRPPTLREHADSAVRHQSTTRYYPLGWRLFYALTIAANVLPLVLMLCAVIGIFPVATLCLSLGAKFVLDAASSGLFCRRLRIDLKWSEFLIAEVILPIYSLWRTVKAFMPSYSWQGRTHPSRQRACACDSRVS